MFPWFCCTLVRNIAVCVPVRRSPTVPTYEGAMIGKLDFFGVDVKVGKAVAGVVVDRAIVGVGSLPYTCVYHKEVVPMIPISRSAKRIGSSIPRCRQRGTCCR